MSLISKADIRYEGVLSHIDMANSEICLTQGVVVSCHPSFAELHQNGSLHMMVGLQEIAHTCITPLTSEMMRSAILWNRAATRGGVRISKYR